MKPYQKKNVRDIQIELPDVEERPIDMNKAKKSYPEV